MVELCSEMAGRAELLLILPGAHPLRLPGGGLPLLDRVRHLLRRRSPCGGAGAAHGSGSRHSVPTGRGIL